MIAAAILRESPEPPRQLRADVPARLEEIILKTLEKDPADRTQTAAELRADLRRLTRELNSGGSGRGGEVASGRSRSAPSRSPLC